MTVKHSKLSQEEEVRKTRNFLQTVIDGIPDQVMVVGRDYRIVLANRAVRKTTGETDPVPEGMLCYQVSHHRDSPCEELEHPCPLKKVFTTGKPVTVIHTHYDTGGNRIFVEINVSPIFNDSGKVVHFIEALRDITERREAEEQIKSSLKEKELLLKEIYHRTKNNFQVISSMLYLQSEYAGDKKVSGILDKCYDRIKSMASVHEHLYKSEDFTHIDFAEYVRDLLVSLYHSYGISEKTIAFQINIDNIFLGLDMAVPCGLIINELISNSLKHAFGQLKKDDRQNAKISVDMHKTDDSKLVLIVNDNGSGLAGDLNSMNGKTFGLYLIKNLVKQLDGAIEFNTDNGTKFMITFPYNMG